MAAISNTKVTCLNPNTGGSIRIDKAVYDLFAKAIYHSLKKSGDLTYTEMVNAVKACLQEQQIEFKGSLNWYVITVKNDMEARGVITVSLLKGKKRNSLSK